MLNIDWQEKLTFINLILSVITAFITIVPAIRKAIFNHISFFKYLILFAATVIFIITTIYFILFVFHKLDWPNQKILVYRYISPLILSFLVLSVIYFIPKFQDWCQIEKDKIVVAVADFSGVTQKDQYTGKTLANTIAKRLEDKFRESNLTNFAKVVKLKTIPHDWESAEKLGSKAGRSAVVLWGQATVEAEQRLFLPSISIVNPPEGMVQPKTEKSKIITGLSQFQAEVEQISENVLGTVCTIVGLIHYWKGEFKIAAENFDEAYENSEITHVLFYSGNCYNNLNQLSNSIDRFEKLLQHIPDHHPTMNNLGVCYMDMNMPDKANMYFDKIIEHDSQLSYAWTNKGTIFLRNKDYRKAIDCFEKANSINSCDPINLNNLGLTYIQLGDNKTAISKFKQALNCEQEQLFHIRFNLGTAYANLKNYKEAEKWYLHSIEVCPDSSTSYYQLAVIQTQLKKFDDAVNSLLKLIVIKKDDAEINNFLGEIYLSQSNFDKSIDYFQKALALNLGTINSDRIYFNIALSYSNSHKFSDAIKHYKSAIYINPDFYEALHNLAALEFQNQNFIEAEKHAFKAHTICPDSVNTWNLLADIYSQSEQQDKLQKFIESLEKENDEQLIEKLKTILYYNTGLQYFNKSKYNEAIQELKNVIKNYPDDRKSNELLGMCYIKLRDYKNAIPAMKLAIKKDDPKVGLYYNLGFAYFELGQFNEAIYYLLEAKKADNELADIYLLLGQIYMQQRHFQMALKEFENVVNLNPNDAETFYKLGVTFFNLHQYENAIENLQRAINLSWENSESYFLLGLSHFHLKDYENALNAFTNSNRLKEDYNTYLHRSYVFSKLKRNDDAIQSLERALELKPEGFLAQYNLAIFAANRNLVEEALTRFRLFLDQVIDDAQYKDEIKQAKEYINRYR